MGTGILSRGAALLAAVVAKSTQVAVAARIGVRQERVSYFVAGADPARLALARAPSVVEAARIEAEFGIPAASWGQMARPRRKVRRSKRGA